MSASMPAYMSDPTDEQLAALNMAMDQKSFKVVAYAGAGKTTTLKLIGERLRGRGLYLAFNKAIANDARSKFPPHVECRTFHSLAYRHVARDITAKLSLPRFSPKRLGDDLGLQPVQVRRQMDGVNKYITLTPARLSRFVSDAVSNFCSTHASYPAPRHILFPSWLDDSDAEQLREILYPAVEQRWLQSIDARHPAGIGHDIYLKLWALSKPSIPADFILFDEAQDADPLMMGILTQQSRQVIYVGDTLLKALQEDVPLKGNPNKQSSTDKGMVHSKKDAILCRTNAAAMSQLLTGLKHGHRVALQADTDRMLKFCQAAENLKNGKSAYGVPELAYFYNWGDVQEYAETNEGSDLKTLVKLVDDHGTNVLSQACNSLTSIENADYVISTAHKAKGREWGKVQLDDDFYYDVTTNAVKITPEELRLLYVACTRAQSNLDIHNIKDLISGLQTGKKVIFGNT